MLVDSCSKLEGKLPSFLMKYSRKELYVIRKKRPDLIPKPDPSTNTAIIAFLRKHNKISQIPKDMQSKEWFNLRQQTLDNKDFPKFQTDHFNEVIEHNQNIDKKLEDPQTQKELDFLIKKYAIAERIKLLINPLYLYSKYQKYKKQRTEKKFYKINLPNWIWIIFCALIILIIISL
tara:strand:+ start:82 stop:609 length:528 start_codon:yes stop_codon:yes gene_type:complete